ncbi:hypothetical protein Tco_1390395 [Tanacetum coccineum]
MPPTLFMGIDRDVRELYTRPVLAMEAWAGHVDTRMEDMSQTGYDDHRLIHDMLVQHAALHQLGLYGNQSKTPLEETDLLEGQCIELGKWNFPMDDRG